MYVVLKGEVYFSSDVIRIIEKIRHNGGTIKMEHISRDEAFTLLKKYNKSLFHIQHALTGLIWAAALMRPSKSTKDMEIKSLKKKYKSKGFAAGCSREVIEKGAKQLGWELEKLLTMTLAAMAASEDTINEEMAAESAAQ